MASQMKNFSIIGSLKNSIFRWKKSRKTNMLGNDCFKKSELEQFAYLRSGLAKKGEGIFESDWYPNAHYIFSPFSEEAYLEPSRTSKMELFRKSSWLYGKRELAS